MPVKIRLARRGRKKNAFYHIVIADARAPRDGKFIENIGSYNPGTVPATITLDRDKAFDWLQKGAQPTNTVRAIMKFKGVYYRKHLLRGVAKGALSEDKAMEMYNEWIEAKEAKIAARVEETKQKKADFWKMVSGEIKAAKPKADVAAAEAFRETEATEAEAPAAETEAPAAEPVAETPAAPEKPAVEAKAPVAETPEPVAVAPTAPEPTKEASPEVEKPAETVEEKVAEAAPVVEAAKAEETTEVKADDLTKIEGVGPAIAKLLNGGGIMTFADLAAKSAEDVKAILTEAGPRFQMHDPSTWGQQADMAAKGEWDALKKLQDELDGGKPATSSEEE